MRVWIVSAALAVAALGGLPTATFAAATQTPTPRAQASPSATITPTLAKPTLTATPTRAVATSSPTPRPTATVQPTPTARAAAPAAVVGQAPAPPPRPVAPPANPPAITSPAATPPPTIPPTPSVAPTQPPSTLPPAARGAIHGQTFVDTDANGQLGSADGAFVGIDISLSSANGLARTTRSGEDGTFAFDGLAPGDYRVTLAVPNDFVPTTDAGQDVVVEPDTEVDGIVFGLISMQAAGLKPAADMDDEQIIALASVSSLPLRFAQGRDLMAQVGRRVLGDGLVWLGVPFRSQIDGGDFQYVNCGPASLTMVLAAFGLEVGPSQVRDYLNNLIDNFDTDLGTSLDVLSRIGKEAGLTPMDLYSDGGGYRNWSPDAVRWHVQQGHPVITLVKYRNLPGHSRSLSEFDHYIVISGLTPNGFIYNDAAFASTLGYGLEISDIELEYAWETTSIPHHALALGLAPDKKALSFPETPRTRRPLADAAPAAVRNARRLAESDEADRAPLVLTPTVRPVFAATGPLITAADRWQEDPDFDIQPPLEDGSPMGLNMEQTEQPTLEARPGPGAVVPKLLTVLGAAWLLWATWSFSGRLVRRRFSFAPLRAALVALLGLTR
jgi:hypothetical protein